MSSTSLTSFDSADVSASRDRAVRDEPSMAGIALTEFPDRWTRVQLSVRAYLLSRLFDRVVVDDCLQEVAILAWRKAPRKLDDRAFLGWCIACARRVSANEIRRKGRSRLSPLSPDVLEDLADGVAAEELRELGEAGVRIAALRGCLEQIDPRHRRLLEARYSCDPVELGRVADSAGMSMPAIYKRLERLRAVLRDCVTRVLASQE